MRAAVLLLILVNVILFGYARLDRAAQSEGERLAQQVQPERIRVLSAQEVAALTPARAAARADICVEWGPFADADRARAEADLEPRLLGKPVSQRPVAVDAGYWVHLDAMPNRAAAERRAGELRAQSISDLSVIDFGRGQFTVSLGVFRTEAAASARADALTARGVAGTRVEPRPPAAPQSMIVVHDAPPPVVAEIRTLQSRYTGTDVKVAPCGPVS
jgi:hypothetical protein